MDVAVVMIIVVSLILLWIFRSISQSGIIKKFFRIKKESETKALKWADGLEEKSTEFSRKWEEKIEKDRIENVKNYVIETQKINIDRESVGLEKVNINDEIKELKELGVYEEIVHLIKPEILEGSSLSYDFHLDEVYDNYSLVEEVEKVEEVEEVE